MSLSENHPILLLKLGIEFVQTHVRKNYNGQKTESDISELYIIDKYLLQITYKGLKLGKADSNGMYENITEVPGISEKIIEEMKEYAKEKFGIEL